MNFSAAAAIRSTMREYSPPAVPSSDPHHVTFKTLSTHLGFRTRNTRHDGPVSDDHQVFLCLPFQASVSRGAQVTNINLISLLEG